jgi:hypothetical protein
MLGLESSVMARDRQGSSNVACAAASLRPVPSGGRATTGRIAVTLGSACQAQARRTASGAEPMTNRGPVRARHDHGGTQLAAWPARLRAVALRSAPPRRGLLEERARSPGQPARPGGSARTRRGCTTPTGCPGRNRGRGRGGRGVFGSPAAPRPPPADPLPGSTVGALCGSGLAVPACLVGWSESPPARAVRPGDPPEDTPAGGDRHPARIRVRQGPQMHLLAEARRPPPVHPADLRPGLRGVPHPRPAVLQPRRPAVPGARHRAAGGGTGPAVADQGDDERRHYPGTGVVMTLAAGGLRAGSGSASATPLPAPPRCRI